MVTDQELREKSIRYISFILSPFSSATKKKKKAENQINYKLSLYIKLREGKGFTQNCAELCLANSRHNLIYTI